MKRIRGGTAGFGEETASSELEDREVLTRLTPWRLTRRSRDSARWLLRGTSDAPGTLATASKSLLKHQKELAIATKGFCGAPRYFPFGCQSTGTDHLGPFASFGSRWALIPAIEAISNVNSDGQSPSMQLRAFRNFLGARIYVLAPRCNCLSAWQELVCIGLHDFKKR